MITMCEFLHYILVFVRLTTGPGARLVIEWLLIVIRFVLMLCEVFVVTILFKGRTAKSMARALLVSFVTSVVVASVYTGIDIYLQYGASQLKIDRGESVLTHTNKGGSLFLLCVCTVKLIGYLVVFLLRYTPWKIYAPVKRSFYRYVACLLVVNVLDVLAHALLLGGESVGNCFKYSSSFLYQAFYGILLYLTFLREFFRTQSSTLAEARQSLLANGMQGGGSGGGGSVVIPSGTSTPGRGGSLMGTMSTPGGLSVNNSSPQSVQHQSSGMHSPGFKPSPTPLAPSTPSGAGAAGSNRSRAISIK